MILLLVAPFKFRATKEPRAFMTGTWLMILSILAVWLQSGLLSFDFNLLELLLQLRGSFTQIFSLLT